MSTRNIFESLKKSNNKHVNFTNEYVLSRNGYKVLSEQTVKKELQAIAIFSDHNDDAVKKFIDENEIPSHYQNDDITCNVENIEKPNSLKILYTESINPNFSNFANSFKKHENRLPYLLVEKIDNTPLLENNLDMVCNSKPPLQIEIDSGLDDIKKSVIITKKDLLSISKLKNQNSCKRKLNFNHSIDDNSNIDKNEKKKCGDNIETLINDKSIKNSKKENFNLKKYSLTFSKDKIKDYYLLFDVSQSLGLGIIEFICQYLMIINCLEISYCDFQLRCITSFIPSELHLIDSSDNNIISLIEINEQFHNFINNIDDIDIHKISQDLEQNIDEEILLDKNNKSCRKQNFIKKFQNFNNKNNDTIFYKHHFMIFEMFFDLQLLIDVCINKINQCGGRAMIEQLEKREVNNNMSPKNIPQMLVVCAAKDCAIRILNQISKIAHYFDYHQIKYPTKSVNIETLSTKLIVLIKDIDNWKMIYIKYNSYHFTLTNEAMKIIICLYKFFETVKDFLKITRQSMTI